LDVRITKDNRFIISHDEDLSVATTVKGKVADKNVAEFAKILVVKSTAIPENRSTAKQAFIAALLARFGTLLAIYYLPQEYSEICRLMEEEGVDQSTASCRVLGLNLHTLGRMIAEHLHFPRLLIEAMQAPTEEPEQAPHDAGQATLQIAGFAAQVGDIFRQPGDERDVALRELSQKYDAALDIEEDHLYELIEQNLHAALDLIEMPKEWAHDAEARLRSLRSRPEAEVHADDVPQESSEELALPPPSGGIATVTSGGDGARAFIYELRASGAEPDANEVFAEAERLQGKGNLEDAYLLYRFAARHGQAQAALNLGTQADPAFHATATSYLPEPEPAQAYKWYSVALAAGNEEAVVRMQNLHKRVQRNAANGDEQAQRLLLQWQ